MTTLNDLFKELNDVKKESKKAHKEKVEKYNLIESPNELDIQNEMKDIFSQLSNLKEQAIEHQIQQQEQKQKEEKILTGLEKILQEKTEEVEKSIESEDKEEIKEEIQPVEEYTQFITKEEEKREKKVIKEATELDALQKEIELLKKRISSLSVQITTAPTKFPEGNSGGELNLVKPIKITDSYYRILGTGGNDVFLCYTNNHDISIYLPDAEHNHGMKVHVKKMHRNHHLYIRGYNTNQLIDEKELVTVSTIYLNYIMVCDGKDWYIV